MSDILAAVGTFLTGVASICAVIIGNREWSDYWRKKHSEAASLAWSYIGTGIDDIMDISREAKQVGSGNVSSLIKYTMDQLTKDLRRSQSLLFGKPAVELEVLKVDLQKQCRILCGAVYQNSRGEDREQQIFESHQSLLDISKKAENLLRPIIEAPRGSLLLCILKLLKRWIE